MAIGQSPDCQTSVIKWLTHYESAQYLGISPSQYRRDKALLSHLGIIDRDKYSKGNDYPTLAILQEFRQLIVERGRKSAAKELLRRHQDNADQ